MKKDAFTSLMQGQITRPLLSEIQLLKVTVSKQRPKRGRRGRYIFRTSITYFIGEADFNQSLTIYIFPKAGKYFLYNQIKKQAGQNAEEAIEQVSEDGCITNERLFKADLREVKALAIEAIQHAKDWQEGRKCYKYTIAREKSLAQVNIE